jgi:hypothetical protein
MAKKLPRLKKRLSEYRMPAMWKPSESHCLQMGCQNQKMLAACAPLLYLSFYCNCYTTFYYVFVVYPHSVVSSCSFFDDVPILWSRILLVWTSLAITTLLLCTIFCSAFSYSNLVLIFFVLDLALRFYQICIVHKTNIFCILQLIV